MHVVFRALSYLTVHGRCASLQCIYVTARELGNYIISIIMSLSKTNNTYNMHKDDQQDCN